ncbi:hypothetical protein ACSNNV_16420, partial [Faecalibacterium prausnitzii]|uniref:hypothetical protein n=1 Tax=Faecalibacterium prausnitzii TaxID=853 RepID=UPI003F1C41AF
QLQRHYSTAPFGLQGHSANRDETGMKMGTKLFDYYCLVKRVGVVQPSLFFPKFPLLFLAPCRNQRIPKTFC